MKVVVISASPKGKNSVSLQSAEFLKRHNPQDEFDIIHVGNKVKKYSDAEAMDGCIEKMANSDLIIFVYPVYTFLVPYQLAKFINFLKQRPNASKLEDKFVSQISTSKHFYDTTAHRYIIENCDDLGMKSITGLAADMEDLLCTDGVNQLKDYYKSVQFAVKHNIYNHVARSTKSDFDYIYCGGVEATPKKEGFDTVLVTDCTSENKSLKAMIDAFIDSYEYKVRVVNIADFKFSGGCLGCFECATDGMCVYKDGFENLLRNEVQNAHATIIAASITDHSLGPIFKCYDDRQFCNGHRVMTKGKSVGYILDGNLSAERNLLDVIEARSDVAHMYLSGIAVSESASDDKITKSIVKLAKSTAFSLENALVRPQSFFGIGGMKIFRDLIYVMRGLMKEDHEFYKKNGAYDFPQKQKGMIIKMKLAGLIMAIPAVKKKIGGTMNEIILKPYKQAIEKG